MLPLLWFLALQTTKETACQNVSAVEGYATVHESRLLHLHIKVFLPEKILNNENGR